ncbi:MAG: hypothetical protein UE295_11485 [Acutalibacteraceae bacterium]|nr:hypothetical protein [Acutalibacteraceae bacterium]
MKQCSRCKADNYDEAYLCKKCGAKLKKKKNKSLDLDVQNYSNPRPRYDQQQYQGQSYDSYAQQNYQQQYQANQQYYDPYQAQQYSDTYQAQSQNIGNTDSAVNNTGYDNSYNNSFDNSYSNSFDNSYNNSFDNSYSNSFDNSYNNSFDNSYSNSYNNSYDNNSSDNSYNSDSFNNSFNNNQQQTKYGATQQQPADNATDEPKVTFTESHNGNKHTYTATTKRVVINGGHMHKTPENFEEALGEFANVFSSHVAQNSQHLHSSNDLKDKAFLKFADIVSDFAEQHNNNMQMNNSPLNVGDYVTGKVRESIGEAIYANKNKRSSASRVDTEQKGSKIGIIIAVIALVATATAVGATMVYNRVNTSSDTGYKSSVIDKSSYTDLNNDAPISLKLAEKTYTLYGDKNDKHDRYAYDFKLPEGYYVDIEKSNDTQISFAKDKSNTSTNDNKNQTIEGVISLKDKPLEKELSALSDSYENVSTLNYERRLINTPEGNMTIVAVEGAGCYNYYGLIPFRTDKCIYLHTSAIYDEHKEEAYAVFHNIAKNIKLNLDYTIHGSDTSDTIELTDNVCTITHIGTDKPIFKFNIPENYEDPLKAITGEDNNNSTQYTSGILLEKRVDDKAAIRGSVQVIHKASDQLINEDYSDKTLEKQGYTIQKPIQYYQTSIGRMTLIKYNDIYEHHTGIIPVGDDDCIEISFSSYDDKYTDELKEIFDIIAFQGELIK